MPVNCSLSIVTWTVICLIILWKSSTRTWLFFSYLMEQFLKLFYTWLFLFFPVFICKVTGNFAELRALKHTIGYQSQKEIKDNYFAFKGVYTLQNGNCCFNTSSSLHWLQTCFRVLSSLLVWSKQANSYVNALELLLCQPIPAPLYYSLVGFYFCGLKCVDVIFSVCILLGVCQYFCFWRLIWFLRVLKFNF